MTTASKPHNGGYEITQVSEGVRVLVARTVAGLTQQQLADRVRVDRQTIGNIERDRHDVRPIVRQNLAKELSVTEHWLQTGELETDGDGGKPIDINRGREARTGYKQRRTHRPDIVPSPAVHELPARRAA